MLRYVGSIIPTSGRCVCLNHDGQAVQDTLHHEDERNRSPRNMGNNLLKEERNISEELNP
jgi:hypothetical protein